MKSTDFQLSSTEFPFKTFLSFTPLISYWQSKINDDNKGISRFAKEISRQLQHAPKLMEPCEDCSGIQNHEDLVELLMTALFPPATWETAMRGALIPFQNTSFYHTPKFREIFIHDNNQLKRPLNMDARTMLCFMTRQALLAILENVYHVPVPLEEAAIFTVPDYQLGLYRHYKVGFNNNFMKVKSCSDKTLTEADIKLLLSNMDDLDLWLSYLPPSDYAFEGFYVMDLVDVTEQEMLSAIKLDLLEKDVLMAANQFEQLQEKLRIFFGRPHLQLGVAAFNNKKNTFVNFGRKINHSFLIPQTESTTNSLTFKAIYDKLIQEYDPIVVEDMKTTTLPDEVKFHIREMGINSMILALLRFGDQILGILELGSPYVNDLNNFSLTKIAQFLPHFAAALRRNAEDLESRVQNVIKEKFTNIHPVLEWRFKEAALNLLEQRENGDHAEIEPIVFQDVYPLYGFSDIRGSSTERNVAIQGDLLEHLRLVEKVLKQAIITHSLPILDELKFYISKTLRKLRRGIISQDEAAILEVIKKHVEPIFTYLENHNPDLKTIIENYYQAMDPRLGILYKRRKAFEESLTRINQTISDYLDQEEEKAQKMYPHYYEKFKTDGVEFNIYMGASLVDNPPFNMVFLKNLRLWQLMTMCEITRRTAALKSELPLPLETTQLILIYSQPLAIRFRRDERKFDVDGAYNIRYEIVKKRIDKATVAGTQERLTQPGSVALVYAQGREANEYKEYIDYLQNIGLLRKELEDLDLEELQGVSGLKALRVWVRL